MAKKIKNKTEKNDNSNSEIVDTVKKGRKKQNKLPPEEELNSKEDVNDDSVNELEAEIEDEKKKDKKETAKKKKRKKKNKFNESSISWYLEQINKIPLLSREDENRLANASQNGDEKSKENLIKANLRFVVTIAKKYQTSGISLLDLINEGNLGLIKAAERFDPGKGFHFISYAIWWIRQAIILAISQKTTLIRLPMNRTVDIQKIEKVHRKLENELGREPTPSEISVELDMDDEEVSYLRSISVSQEHVSLDSSFGEADEMSVISTLEDYGNESPDRKVIDESLRNALETVLDTLTDSEKEILKMRFGLDGDKPMSLQQIGDKFHLSKERIRQIEKKAIRRLRHPSRSQQLKTFLGH